MELKIVYYKNNSPFKKIIYINSSLASIAKSYKDISRYLDDYNNNKITINNIIIKISINHIVQKLKNIPLDQISNYSNYLKLFNLTLKISSLNFKIKFGEVGERSIDEKPVYYDDIGFGFYWVEDIIKVVDDYDYSLDKQLWSTKSYSKDKEKITIYIPFKN